MEQLRIHPDERFKVFVVFYLVIGSHIARNRLLEPVQRRIDHILLAGFNFLHFLLWEKCRTANIVTASGCCKPKPEATQLDAYRHQSKYCFTSLSAQSWEYRDKREAEVGTKLYTYRMPSRVLYSAQYHRQHCALQTFEQFGQPRWHTSDPAGIRNQDLWVSSHN